MKFKVGDKVRVKSKEWWDAQSKDELGYVKCGADRFLDDMALMCGRVVTITGKTHNAYHIKEFNYNWTDEMFEDEVVEETENQSQMAKIKKDIADIIKRENLGVSVSEKYGKLIRVFSSMF